MATRIEITDDIRGKIQAYILEFGSIKNSEVRELLDISYDQAIHLFNQLIKEGSIIRIGKTTNTKYIIPSE